MVNPPENDEIEDAMYARAQQIQQRPQEDSPCSLKERCFKYYIFHMGCIDEELIFNSKEEQTITAESSFTMPNFLRNQLIDYLQEMRDEYSQGIIDGDASDYWCSLICILLNKDLKKLNHLFRNDDHQFGYFGPVVKAYHTVLMQIPISACNLEEFCFDLSGDLCYTHKCLSPRVVMGVITSLKNLTSLSCTGLGFLFDEQLQEICFALPNLISLKVGLTKEISENGLAHLVTLKNLKAFYFSTRKSGNFSFELTRIFTWCARNLPNLELCCKHVPDYYIHPYNLFEYANHPTVFSETSQLKIMPTAQELPAACLPNLKILIFEGPIAQPDDFFSRLISFRKLTCLMMRYVQEGQVSLILDTIGLQLNSLQLHLDPIRYSDFKIFATCPKLITLQNYGSYNQEVSSKELKKIAGLAPEFLKTVELHFDDKSAPNRLLKLLFTAPQIESLKLDNLKLTKRDCLSFHGFEGAINSSFTLKYLIMRNLSLDEYCDLSYLENMLKHVICNFPNLEIVGIYFEDGESINQKCPNLRDYLLLLDFKA